MTKNELYDIAFRTYNDGTNSLPFDKKTFRSDYSKFMIIRKMAKRFIGKGKINEKLLLNNIIIVLNVFGIETVNIIIKEVCGEKEHSIVISFLMFLKSYIPAPLDPDPNPLVLDILKDVNDRARGI